jgi:peptidyl-Lys metalloendopeptidase
MSIQLVHESSHFTRNGGTQNFAYGQPACRTLAWDHPEEAVGNADSHEYFAENNSPLA